VKWDRFRRQVSHVFLSNVELGKKDMKIQGELLGRRKVGKGQYKNVMEVNMIKVHYM
jgi:hypothetical protein